MLASSCLPIGPYLGASGCYLEANQQLLEEPSLSPRSTCWLQEVASNSSGWAVPCQSQSLPPALIKGRKRYRYLFSVFLAFHKGHRWKSWAYISHGISSFPQDPARAALKMVGLLAFYIGVPQERVHQGEPVCFLRKVTPTLFTLPPNQLLGR